VRENSAGYFAGIKTGDKIISINGNPTSEMDLSELNNYFDSKPGKRIRCIF